MGHVCNPNETSRKVNAALSLCEHQELMINKWLHQYAFESQ